MPRNIEISKQLADEIRLTASEVFNPGAADDAESAADFLNALGDALMNLEAPVAALLTAIAAGDEDRAAEIHSLRQSLHKTARLCHGTAEFA